MDGRCQYELLGLWHLLAAQKDAHCCMSSQGGGSITSDWDLIIMALSAESVVGWVRHLRCICELKKQVPCKIMVLVPEKLKALKVLRNICTVYSGHEGLRQLTHFISAILTKQDVYSGAFSLTAGQCVALADYQDGDGVCP